MTEGGTRAPGRHDAARMRPFLRSRSSIRRHAVWQQMVSLVKLERIGERTESFADRRWALGDSAFDLVVRVA